MPHTSIRKIEGQEMLDLSYHLSNYAFHPTPPFPNRAEWEGRMQTRVGPQYYALFEDNEGVAIIACPTLTQNVRGQIFKMAGVADVSTHPGARRKGYVRELMRAGYRQMQAQGYVVSSLYPFRESFYERLGYVTFPQAYQVIFQASDLHPLFQKDLRSEAELMLIGEGYETYLGYLRQMQLSTHGMGLFVDPQTESAQENRSWLLLVKESGQVTGLILYTIKGEEMMNYTFQATRFYYRTAQAKYRLLEWIARHVGQAGNVRLWLSPSEQPNTWLADLRPKIEPIFVAPMGRVLDVQGIQGMETGPGSFSAEIVDPDCPWNNGTWKFRGDSGKLEVTPAPSADGTLTIQGLSALVYGVNDPADFAIRGWGDPSSERIATLRQMFPPKLPYLHEYY